MLDWADVFRIDPIVSEEHPLQHAHTLHGGQSRFCVSTGVLRLTSNLDLNFSRPTMAYCSLASQHAQCSRTCLLNGQRR